VSAPILFPPLFRAFDTAGNPLAGGQLFTYAAGTTTPLATYSDDAGTIQNANPVILDTTGSAVVRLGTSAYKFVLKDAGGSTQYTVDHYVGTGDNPVFTTLTVSSLSTLDSIQASSIAISGTGTFGALSAPGLPLAAIKSADLSRNTTQTYANDPDLTLNLGVGKYEIEATLFFNCTTTGTQGFKAKLTGSATATGLGVLAYYANAVSTPVPALNTFNNAWYAGQADLAGSTTDYLQFRGTLIITVAGTVTIQWAQNSATGQANNTTLYAGSRLVAVQLA
jgi:hypothetical protein